MASQTRLFPHWDSNTQDIDGYLNSFERAAAVSKWDPVHWVSLLRTQLVGKALRMFTEMDMSLVNDYDEVKEALLSGYELISETYRERFQGYKKPSNENYVDSAYKLTIVFNRWITSVNVHTFDELKQLIFMNQFSKDMSADLRVYLSEKKCTNISEMDKKADEFTVLRKVHHLCSDSKFVLMTERGSIANDRYTLCSPQRAARYHNNRYNRSRGYHGNGRGRGQQSSIDNYKCFNCSGTGHWSYECSSPPKDDKKVEKGTSNSNSPRRRGTPNKSSQRRSSTSGDDESLPTESAAPILHV